jgi:4-hydroxy-3-polyprenylbenzoate decarboxylase
VVTARTVPLEVPATAEIVLEGSIHPNDKRPEGPFGEFTGYYGDGPIPRPVIRLSAMTFRDRPLFQGVYEGRPPTCDSVAGILPHEAEIVRLVNLPELKKLRLCAGAATFMAIASVAKRYDGQERAIGQAILATPTGRWIKTLVLVDEDIDPANWTDVEWAIGTRFQPAEDLLVLHHMGGVMLDPSLPAGEVAAGTFRSSKVILDATRPVGARFAEACQPDPEVMRRVESHWERYGIPLPIKGRRGSAART